MKQIDEAIRREARKLIVRYERYAKDLDDEFRRRNRRSGRNDRKQVLRPSYWSLADGFNPYLVRSRVQRIGFAVRSSLKRYTYVPRCAVSYSVPKSEGTLRKVSVFQIADAAISRLAFKSLLDKNRCRLSAYSFAYREDLTVHDAIQHIAGDIRDKKRVFVAEYDFSRYFDSIYHEHIWRILTDRQFLFTQVEKVIIDAFLSVPILDESQYVEIADVRRERGLPQGTSISLFLANVAAWPLDRTLERLGVGFARYADDTLIWSHDYSRICEAAEALNDAAKAIGADLNLKKSEGISLLVPGEAPAEFKRKECVEFVGYAFSPDGISIRRSSLKRIRQHIAYLIYKNLLEEPRRGNIVGSRFRQPVDRDYVVLIYQIRRYLYGDLSERKLRRYLSRVSPKMHYKGVMAFYPLVDAKGFLSSLDGWLLHTVYTTLRKRREILLAAGHRELPPPLTLKKADLPDFFGRSRDGTELDLRLPSFSRIGRLLGRASRAYGPNAIGHPRANLYYLGA